MADETMPENKLINRVSVSAANMPTEKTLSAALSNRFSDQCCLQPSMDQENVSTANNMTSCGAQASSASAVLQINNTSSSNDTKTTTTTTTNTTASAVNTTTQSLTTSSVAGPTTTAENTDPPTMPARLSPVDFCFGKTIGEGSFSTVYLAKCIHTSKEFAIKVCEKALIIRRNMQRYVQREREIMHLLSKVPGFVNLYCTFQDARNLYFVMTYAKNGDLLPYINKVGSFDLNCTRYYTAELVVALERLHTRGLIHRDLKPENILLDENMHTLIADFGSAKNLAAPEPVIIREDDEFGHQRRSSFVGTAQYVSPEVLQGQLATNASDLWALGCIVYQMIAGLPPFRAPNEYLIYQKILKVEFSFPEGFDEKAAELVKGLLRIKPLERLGASDDDIKYNSIRKLPFFENISWDTLRTDTPPPIYPYLPGVQDDAEVINSQYRIPDNLEPGFSDRQQTRLLGHELGTSNCDDNKQSETNGGLNLTNKNDLEQRMKIQREKNYWDKYSEGELILKHGMVNKRKGLFSRKRMLLLTTGPRLIYIDPVQMVKKGEIPWSVDLRVEAKNFKVFFVHTPNRTYYLEDPEGFALTWCQAIKELWTETYG